MEITAAFDTLVATISRCAGKRLLEASLDQQSFGNFVISYDEAGTRWVITNDRGFVTLESDRGIELQGAWLRDLDEQALLQKLKL